MQMALTAADMWAEGYKDRQKEDEGAEFLDERLPLWLDNVERSLGAVTGPFMFGAQPAFCDFEM